MNLANKKSGCFRPVAIPLVVALCVGLLTGSPAHALTLKIATLAPDGTEWMEKMRAGGAEVTRRTQGRVKFKFYPGGVMGSDKTVRRKIRIGQLQGGAITGGALQDVYPDSQIYNLPMLFKNYEEVDYVRKHLDKRIRQGLEDHGFVTFGITDGGFAYLMSKAPVHSMDDLHGRKIWVPEGDVFARAVFTNMGITPIPLPLSDVYIGLQTGLIDTIGGSPIGAIALQWYTQVEYVTDAPLMYLYGVLAIDRRAFTRIQPADQIIVRKIMGRVFSELNHQNRIDNQNATKALHQQGLKFVAMTANEFKRLDEHVARTREDLGRKGYYSQAMIKSLVYHLSVFRKQRNAKAN